ncbi:cytochrome P450 [Streptomyces sp. NBC_01190]|uniref:cytochrome P450 n=1 Tax=Streptomyces sp. NBC_01190 TaxID=2903767 RepID=UPI00386AF8E7
MPPELNPALPLHPDAAPVRLHSPAFQRDPAGLYTMLRQVHGPVAPVLLDGDLPAWLVLGYRELHYVTGNPELFGRDSRRWHSWGRVPRDWPLLPFVAHNASVLFTEGADHRRRAGAISDVLAALDQYELRYEAERAADEAVDSFAGAGRAELVAEYAGRIPLRVLAGLFGLRDDETAELHRDSAAVLEDGPDAGAAFARIHGHMELLLERARHRPGTDLASRLLAHPARLRDEEIVQDLIAIMATGQQPTANWIGNTLRLMLTDDRFAVSLSGGRRSVGQALTEVLWMDTPTQNFIGRWATRDTQLAGRHIRAGDLLVLGLAAANTDPQVCPVTGAGGRVSGRGTTGAGGNQAHLSFSHGDHRCPAPAPEIAELIATAAIEVLLDRLPDLRLSRPPEDLSWRPSVWLRGPAALPVEFTPLI